MARWLWITLLLCMYGFLREVRPSESFLTQYLNSTWKNLTLETINNEIYPVWTYSYVALLFVVLLITDFLRYKPVIVLEGIAYVVTWVLLLWAQGVLAMQFMEFSYGVVTATEVAYYTYIYAKIAPQFYKKATSFVRAATLFGKFLSGTLAQILVSTKTMDYHQLNYISLCDVSLACIVAVCLPGVSKSIYFHQKKHKVITEEEKGDDDDGEDGDKRVQAQLSNENDIITTHVAGFESTLHLPDNMCVALSEDNITDYKTLSATNESEDTPDKIVDTHSSDKEISTQSIPSSTISVDKHPSVQEEEEEYERVPCGQVFRVIWNDFKLAYTDPFQIKWCLWWALGTCSYEQVGNYIQTLWEEVYPSQDHEDIYNGAVDAINTLLGALAAISIGFLPLNWDEWGELTLGIVSMAQGVFLASCAVTKSIWVAYIGYILFVTSYYTLITVASYQVAKKLKQDSYGLIFGCNQFFALILQTLMTVIVVDEHVIGAGPRLQFLVYGSYNIGIGVIFLTITLYTNCRTATRSTITRRISD